MQPTTFRQIEAFGAAYPGMYQDEITTLHELGHLFVYFQTTQEVSEWLQTHGRNGLNACNVALDKLLVGEREGEFIARHQLSFDEQEIDTTALDLIFGGYNDAFRLEASMDIAEATKFKYRSMDKEIKKRSKSARIQEIASRMGTYLAQFG